MASALDIVKGAMRLVGALEAGATPSGEDGADALVSLNDILEQWSLDRLLVFQVLNESFTWAAGQASRTIGSGANFDTTRPTRLEEGCTIRDSAGYDWPLKILDSKGYQQISAKSLASSIPEFLYYSPEMPTGRIYIWPVPTVSSVVNIASLKQLVAFTNLATTVVLPPGYVRALKYTLAVAMAVEWTGRDAKLSVQEEAANARAALKRINTKRSRIAVDDGLRVRGGGTYNVWTDGYP